MIIIIPITPPKVGIDVPSPRGHCQHGGGMLRPSLARFPATPGLKDECGLPFGCVVQPFASSDTMSSRERPPAAEVARCSSCFAYINAQCHLQRRVWSCALCGAKNELPSRYQHRGAAGRPGSSTAGQRPPELSFSTYEAVLSINDSQSNDGDSPVFLALVDLTGAKIWPEPN